MKTGNSPFACKLYVWIARTLFVDSGVFETTAGESFVGTETNVDFFLSSIFPSDARSAIEIDFSFYSGLSSLRDSVTPVR